MAAEKPGNDHDQSDLENVSSTMAPKHFVRPMELGIGEEAGGNSGIRQPAKGSTMDIAEYQHHLHELKRIPQTVAIGAPSSYDERHPSHDIHHTTVTGETGESEKQGKSARLYISRLFIPSCGLSMARLASLASGAMNTPCV